MTSADIAILLGDPVIKYYLSALLALYPVGRIYYRAGFSCAWALLLFVPLFGFLLCLMVLASRNWKLALPGHTDQEGDA